MNNKILRQSFIVFSTILFLGATFNVFGKAHIFASTNITNILDENGFSFALVPDDDSESEIFELVNEERRRKRLNQLEWNDDLARIARNYSKKMARENFFDHYDSDGANVIDRAKSARLKNWSKIGENLFFCQGIRNYSGFAVKGWLNSSSHRRNMLDREWTQTGIGVAKSRGGEIYVTQVFMK